MYSKASRYTAPRCTDPADTRFVFGPKIFQIHGFPNIGHSFTPQLHGYFFGPIIKNVTRFLNYTVFQNTLRQCNSRPYCSNEKLVFRSVCKDISKNSKAEKSLLFTYKRASRTSYTVVKE